ncbi:MAG: MarR family transcriptional regulator [Planctomycetes bacterium]|nr:MarR family transcriptional regulator [Planctomycetota bacterium]
MTEDAQVRSTGAPDPAPSAGNESAGPRYELRILRAFRRIIRAVDMYSRKLHNEHDVTGPQLLCLLAVSKEGPLTPSEIGRSAFLSPSTVVGILDRLESKGLVLRERDRQDRRIVRVSVTEKGRTLASRSPSPLQDSLANALEGMTELERATIALSLERVVELMERGS